MTDVQIKKLNAEINWYDPPKDLAEDADPRGSGLRLNQDVHGTVIYRCMKALFGIQGILPDRPDGWVSVGVKSSIVTRNIVAIFNDELLNHRDILREKNNTGHSNRPIGLFVMQDAGPLDIVMNPVLVITPGTIMDPAGKTKTDTMVNLVDSARGQAILTLEKSYTDKMAFDSCITGDIVASNTDDNYIITIPTNLTMGNIIGHFNRVTFRVVTGSGGGIYFQGNPKKNRAILDWIVNKEPRDDEIKAYLLVKELGDTLQVQWVNKLFDIDRKYNKGNTTIITCDIGVKNRAVINGIPVILSIGVKSIFYYQKAQDGLVRKAIINNLAQELYNHNTSVTNDFQAVIEQARRQLPDISRATPGDFFNEGTGWTLEQMNAGIRILQRYLNTLILFTKDLKVRLDIITDISAAEGLISVSHIISPFKNKKDVYKKNNAVISLLPNNRIPFIVSRFVQTNMTEANIGRYFTPDEQVPVPTRGGGSLLMIGGTYNFLLPVLTIVAAVIVSINCPVCQRRVPAAAPPSAAPPSEAAAAIPHTGEQLEQLWRTAILEGQDLTPVVIIPVENPALVRNLVVDGYLARLNVGTWLQGELYCIVKDFFPEIILYARKMIIARGELPEVEDIAATMREREEHVRQLQANVARHTKNHSKGAADRRKGAQANFNATTQALEKARDLHHRTTELDAIINSEEFLNSYTLNDNGLNVKLYNWDEDVRDAFVDNSGLTEELKTNLNRAIARCIVLTQNYIYYYPAFGSDLLNQFILNISRYLGIHFRNIGTYASPPAAAGGGTPPLNTKEEYNINDLSNAADIASDLQELYYSLRIQNSYSSNRKLEDMIQERLSFITDFPLLSLDDYKTNNRRVFELMIKDLASLPAVSNKIPEITPLVEEFYRSLSSTYKPRTMNEVFNKFVNYMVINHSDLATGLPLNIAPVPDGIKSSAGGSRFRNLKYTRKTRRKQRNTRTTRVRRSKRDSKK